mmetsp:Transcript_15071/g.32510  ORF Transcript_15071/g.32510 Transcript_15071/m.32510 type:complete len:97 (+) Transcript_15071:1617-1907(+)
MGWYAHNHSTNFSTDGEELCWLLTTESELCASNIEISTASEEIDSTSKFVILCSQLSCAILLATMVLPSGSNMGVISGKPIMHLTICIRHNLSPQA